MHLVVRRRAAGLSPSNGPAYAVHNEMNGLLVARALALAIAAVSIATSGLARADDPPIDAVAASFKRFDEGRVAFEARRFDEARAAFEASNRLQASPNSLLYIGRCYRETGRLASAYVSFKRSAREAQDRLTATLEMRYGATRDAAASEAAELEARVPRLVIVVPGGLPRDFLVTLDGKPVSPASWGLAVETDPGAVVVEATGMRMRPFRAAFTLEEGEQRRLEVLAARTPTAVVSLALRSRPSGMVIELDGVPLDPREAAEPRELDVGLHRLTLRAPGYLPFRWEKSLEDGERASIAADLAPDPTQRARGGTAPWLFFATAGSAVVAAGLGAGVALSASSLDSEEAAKNSLLRDPAVRDTIRARSTVANVLFVSGAVLGASATVLFFTTDWRSLSRARSGRAALGVSGAPARAAVTFEGAF